MRLKGKTAIITGAASGIGRATAARFAQEGAAVVCGDINLEGCEQTAESIRRDGGHVVALEVDLTRDGSVDEFIGHSREALGHVDILVNNAGVAILGPVAQISPEDWDREISVNLTSIRRTCRAIWSHFVDRNGGVILNTASIAGMTGTPGQVAYGASKGAVIIMSRCMALDGARHRIRVNCVCPGVVETPMVNVAMSAAQDPETLWASFE